MAKRNRRRAAAPRPPAPPAGLTARQTELLLAPIDPGRVLYDAADQPYIEGSDVIRHLNRVFGFVGWSDRVVSLDLVGQAKVDPHTDDGALDPDGRARWMVVYRAVVELAVKAADGTVLAVHQDVACSVPHVDTSLASAHDTASKTAVTQALKRCARKLGDRFGLSLYFGGSVEPVVRWTAIDSPGPAPTDDPPVQPEAPVGRHRTVDPKVVDLLSGLDTVTDIAALRDLMGVARRRRLAGEYAGLLPGPDGADQPATVEQVLARRLQVLLARTVQVAAPALPPGPVPAVDLPAGQGALDCGHCTWQDYLGRGFRHLDDCPAPHPVVLPGGSS